ncbi:MAG: hypothetical protein IPN29_17805 [Saprospiraceae bacterium]|nr:hypothetical protein [Saprospiraceae bacterium]
MINKFARLVESLDKERPAGAELYPYLSNFFAALPEDSDRVWAVYLLQKGIHTRAGTYPVLRAYASCITGIPDWMIDHSTVVTGDKAEALALLFDHTGAKELSLTQVMHFVSDFKSLSDEPRIKGLEEIWLSCDEAGRRLVNKMIMSGFLANVMSQDLAGCLSIITGCQKHTLATRLDTPWQPHQTTWLDLIRTEDLQQENNHPCAFSPVQKVDENCVSRLPLHDFTAEYRWQGKRIQCVWRSNQVSVWTKDGQLIGREVPELKTLDFSGFTSLVLEGCVLNLSGNHGKKQSTTSRQHLIIFHDLHEINDEDITHLAPGQRKELLAGVLSGFGDKANIRFSHNLDFGSLAMLIAMREDAGSRFATGIILKSKTANAFEKPWLEWPAEPIKLRAVIMYVKTDLPASRTPVEYTLGLWKKENDETSLVSITKCPPPEFGHQNESFLEVLYAQVDARFGPVLNLRHHMVVSLKFDYALASLKHKSGYILMRPIMEEWLPGQAANQADDLEALKILVLNSTAL